jgi:hypothetical protein
MLRQIITPISASLAYVPLTQGQFACIDIEDVPRVEGLSWFSDKDTTTGKFYAKCYLPGNVKVRMHTFIFGKKEGHTVDHINCDLTLHNRKGNLRHATPAEQTWNRKLRKDSKSGYKGVNWHKASRKWCARIMMNGKSISLGYFLDSKEAHNAYIAASRKMHGDFSRIS